MLAVGRAEDGGLFTNVVIRLHRKAIENALYRKELMFANLRRAKGTSSLDGGCKYAFG